MMQMAMNIGALFGIAMPTPAKAPQGTSGEFEALLAQLTQALGAESFPSIAFSRIEVPTSGPPGAPPPPIPTGIGGEELKTEEPNAQSKKPDLTATEAILPTLWSSIFGSSPVSNQAVVHLLAPASNGVVPELILSTPTGGSAQLLASADPAQIAFQRLMSAPELGVKMIQIESVTQPMRDPSPQPSLHSFNPAIPAVRPFAANLTIEAMPNQPPVPAGPEAFNVALDRGLTPQVAANPEFPNAELKPNLVDQGVWPTATPATVPHEVDLLSKSTRPTGEGLVEDPLPAASPVSPKTASPPFVLNGDDAPSASAPGTPQSSPVTEATTNVRRATQTEPMLKPSEKVVSEPTLPETGTAQAVAVAEASADEAGPHSDEFSGEAKGKPEEKSPSAKPVAAMGSETPKVTPNDTVTGPERPQPLSAPVNARLIRQVADRIEMLAAAKQDRITIMLDPLDLGEIKVIINQTDGKVEAQVFTQDDRVRAALQGGHAQLSQALELRGVHLKEFQVSDFSPGSRSHSDPRGQDQAQTPRATVFAPTKPATHQISTPRSTGVDLTI